MRQPVRPTLSAKRIAAGLKFRYGNLRRRRARNRLLRIVPDQSRCAEVGVWHGDFSAHILRTVQPTELHLIDPWLLQTHGGRDRSLYGGGGGAQSQLDMDRVHQAVLDRFEEPIRRGVVRVHRLPSGEAAPLFPKGSLDWVYIDGDHTYEGVKADLEQFSTSVRPGGYIAGDDYRVPGWWQDGVTRAVDEFISETRYEVVWLGGEQFILRKPKDGEA